MVHCGEIGAALLNLRAKLSEIKCTTSNNYERCMPSSAALIPNFVRCVYRRMLHVVFPALATLSLKYVLIVYIWPDKVHRR